jgi:DNA-binding response OmpR family regulator
LKSYGRLLERLGYPIRLLGDVDEARRDLRVLEDVELVILDQRMPGLSGLDLRAVRRLRAGLGAAGPKVLLISALLSDDLRARAARLGVCEVLEKPIDPDRLLRVVRSSLTT